MKIPLKWLADYVPLPADTADLVQRLTIAGLENLEKCPCVLAVLDLCFAAY